MMGLRGATIFLVVASARYQVLGFIPQSIPNSRKFVLRVGADAPDDIVARARENAGAAPVQEEENSLFEKELRTDMNEALLKLERRVQDGPEALSVLEVEQLEGELRRISEEMKLNQNKKPARPKKSSSSEPASATAPPPSASANQNPHGSLLHAEPDVIASLKPKESADVEDTSQDEAPAWDGIGGMGQPKGTVNTYVIPGT